MTGWWWRRPSSDHPCLLFFSLSQPPRGCEGLKIDPQVMALVEFCYKASSESKKAKVMVVSWKLSWIAGKLWWSCGYYGGTVENMVDCCNWQYLAQFCWWRYFCWVGVKIIFSPCPHLHFWCHCSCSLLKMIVKTKSKWQVPMSDAMKNKARLALSGGRDIDRSVGKEFVNK